MQDKAYFEVRLQQSGQQTYYLNNQKQNITAGLKLVTFLLISCCIISGVWGIGLGSEKADMNTVPMGNDADSWVMCSDGYLRHNKEEMHRITQIPQEGDTIVNLHLQEWKLFL